MTLIIPDPRWEEPNLLIPGRKPVGPVKIDWNHPLAAGLTVCILFQSPEPRDLVTGAALTKGGGPYFTPAGQYFDEVDDYYTLANVTLTNKLSVACQPIFTDNTGGNFQYFLSWGAVSTENTMNMFLGEISSTASEKLSFVTSTAATRRLYWSTHNGKHLVGSYDSGAVTRTRLYFNGVSQTLENPSNAWSVASVTRDLYIGGRNDLDANRYFGGTLKYLYIYGNRILTAEEAFSLSFDPYQFLIPA